jgi:hypothetical protein
VPRYQALDQNAPNPYRKCSCSMHPDESLILGSTPLPPLASNHPSVTKKGLGTMKNFLWMAGGLCAATVGFLVWGRNRTEPVEVLAHRLEEAWADHHTVV